jgi:Flp pilus assembly protein TadG
MLNHFLDSVPIGILFAVTFLLMLLLLELGFRFGHLVQEKSVVAQTTQVGALMGATLGLLAFMLAFTFSTAQSHFEKRMQLQVDEAMLLKDAFMNADLAEEPFRSRSQDLLKSFVDERLALSQLVQQKDRPAIMASLKQSEEIHKELWANGKSALAADADNRNRAAINQRFLASVIDLMDMHTQRIQAALVNRIPVIIWLTLYFTAVVSMVVVGYQAGLTNRRSPVATISMALAFSSVMMLIMDLDRPLQSLFIVDVTAMEQLAAFMSQARL